MMIEKAVNNKDQDHQKGKDTTEVGHDVLISTDSVKYCIMCN